MVWWALEEGLDGPLFQNGPERGEAHHWAVERVCMIHQLGGRWVRQVFGWSRQKLVCSMVRSCRPQSNSSVGKKQNREYIKIGITTIHY